MSALIRERREALSTVLSIYSDQGIRSDTTCSENTLNYRTNVSF